MSFPRLLLVPLALAASLSTAAPGPLTWERTEVHLAAAAGQRVVEVDFPFRNVSRVPVALLSIETSCRCLSATSPQLTYAAGERGIIAVALAIGDQEGALEKSVTVTTDGQPGGSTELVLRVDVPVTR